NCAEQLADIFCFIFKMSLSLHKVPCLWKESIIVPVPKNNAPTSLNEYRPVALTSLIMKTFERIVKDTLLSMVQANLDPFQFAYRSGRGVDDVICALLNMILAHLEGAKTFVCLVFIDFSSAFNCIQPHILAERLKSVHNIDYGLISWLMDFLTNRSQRVKVNSVLSDVLFSSTGSPQGCVLSPLLFVLYTNECHSQLERCHIIKFADDSVIVSLLDKEDSVHGFVLVDFIDWCKLSFLDINVLKTKEMIVDFRKNRTAISPVVINDHAVEIVHHFKYLGTIIDEKLTFGAHVDAVCKKAHQRMYFLRKLYGFNVDSTFMKMFYSCFIESVITFTFVCWYGSLNLKNRNRLQGIVKVCGKIVCTNLLDLNSVYKARTLRKAGLILRDSSHPLQTLFMLLPSSRRYLLPLCRTNRFKNYFVPVAIGFLNT
ncbi:gastrula zinc finger protein XlCGF28.1-like, partial [Silurus meridionalis]